MYFIECFRYLFYFHHFKAVKVNGLQYQLEEATSATFRHFYNSNTSTKVDHGMFLRTKMLLMLELLPTVPLVIVQTNLSFIQSGETKVI